LAAGPVSKFAVPDRVAAAAKIAGHPLHGAFFEVELPMTRKNSFSILLGPADDGGTCSLTRNELLAKVKEEVDLFPMDYVDLPLGWTGEVVVAAVDRSGVRRLRSGYATWAEIGGYPEKFLELLDHLDSRLARNAPAEPIEVAIDVEPRDIPVRVLPRVVGEGDHEAVSLERPSPSVPDFFRRPRGCPGSRR